MTSLRNRLWLGFGSLLFIVLLVSSLSIIVFTRYSQTLQQVFQENYNSAIYCDAMKDALDRLDLRLQLMIWKNDSAQNIDSTAEETKFRSNLKYQLANCTLAGELEHTRHLERLWDQYHAQLVAFEQIGPTSTAARQAIYQGSLLPDYQEMKQTAQWIADSNMSNMVSVDGQVKQTLLDVRNALLVLVVAGTLAAAFVVGAAGRSIIHPLGALTRSAVEISAGNLDHNLPVHSNDEIGQLADAFNSMAGSLQEFRQLDHDRLVRSRQTTQLAIDSLPDAVFVIGPDDTVEISNDAARKYFGIEPGRNISNLGLDWLNPLYDEVKNHGKIVEPRGYESAIQLFVDGRERFLLPRVVPMLSPDHRQLGVTAILVDVTQLRHVDEAKSNLVSTVSHELRTPLTSQRLLLGLMITSLGPKLSPNEKRMLEVAKADNDRLYRTINDLLGINRIESGHAQFQFGPMSPRDIVVAAVEPLRQLFTSKTLMLNVEAPEGLGLIHADSVAINSALTNLISNALKFTPSGGEVKVTVEEEGENILFTVTDTGPGIPREFRDRIFEKFFRVPVSAGPTGAGLGLSITKNIVEAHGGTIEFACPETGGTTFRFRIPFARQPAEARIA